MIRICLAVSVLLLIFSQISLAQENTRLAPIPNVYLDCNSCDVTYIRTNITFVNYVRDQDDASIYLRINNQRTGGGGQEYLLEFSEMGTTNSHVDTLKYISSSTATGDERRQGLNRYIKIGLIPYVTHTAAVNAIDIFYEEPEESTQEEQEVDDPWNNWVFDVDLRSNMWGEESEFNFGVFSGVEAERTTEKWKIRGRVRGEIRRRNVDVSGERLNVNRDWGDFWSMTVYSLSENLSAGFFAGASFNKVNNVALNTYIAPAIEYNVFPYSEFQNRRFVFQYQLTPNFRRYYNTTIFFKDSEMVMSQQISSRLRYDQRWGRINIGISGRHFFHDTSINRVSINPSLNVRVMRGLSVSASGRYQIINDQLSLELSDDVDPNDPESIIIGVQRPTSYSFSFSFGLSYTFGSIYNNVVNPRF